MGGEKEKKEICLGEKKEQIWITYIDADQYLGQ